MFLHFNNNADMHQNINFPTVVISHTILSNYVKVSGELPNKKSRTSKVVFGFRKTFDFDPCADELFPLSSIKNFPLISYPMFGEAAWRPYLPTMEAEYILPSMEALD